MAKFYLSVMAVLLGTLSLSLSGCAGSGTEKGTNQKDDSAEAVSSNLPIADPFVLCHENTYYAYGTSSDSGFEVYYSEDMESWKKHSEMLLDKKDSYGDKWFWAPEVYYNTENKTFYLYYSAEEHICVATSESPLGPFAQEEKKPMREEKSIDSSLFIDDDGTPYLFFVRFTDGNVIWAAELEKDWMTIKEETLTKCADVSKEWEKSMAKVIEGPSVFKKDGVYYLLYSANHYQSQDYGVGYATASSPLGVWEKYTENPIYQKPTADLMGVGHGAPFVDKDGNWKYIFHAHNSPTEIHPRTSYITGLAMSKEGTLSMGGDIIRPKVIK